MQQLQSDAIRRWFVRHTADLCLVAALVVTLALCVEFDAPGTTDWVGAARQAVGQHLGETGREAAEILASRQAESR